jgi:hypothetical protein
VRSLLLTLFLLTPALSFASAQGGRPPKPPPPPQTELAGFAEAAGYLVRARAIAAALSPGVPNTQKTPGGPRLAVPLLYTGQAVARAFVDETGQLVPRGQEGFLATGKKLKAGAQATLRAQVSALTVSSLARVMGPQVHCYLLLNAQVVTELRFDRQTGELLEDRGPPGKDDKDKKGPEPGKP